MRFFEVNVINWVDISWKHLSLIDDEERHQSLAREGLRILRFCIVSWKDERISSIKYCLGRQIDVVQKFTSKQNLGQN